MSYGTPIKGDLEILAGRYEIVDNVWEDYEGMIIPNATMTVNMVNIIVEKRIMGRASAVSQYVGREADVIDVKGLIIANTFPTETLEKLQKIIRIGGMQALEVKSELLNTLGIFKMRITSAPINPLIGGKNIEFSFAAKEEIDFEIETI